MQSSPAPVESSSVTSPRLPLATALAALLVTGMTVAQARGRDAPARVGPSAAPYSLSYGAGYQARLRQQVGRDEQRAHLDEAPPEARCRGAVPQPDTRASTAAPLPAARPAAPRPFATQKE